MDLIKHLHRQMAFSEKTFGPGVRTKAILDHIRKELKEIEAAPHDLEEWVDLVLLALDGAWRAGHAPEGIAEGIVAKLLKNENRDWPDWRTADPDKAIEHVRDLETELAQIDKNIDRVVMECAQEIAFPPLEGGGNRPVTWQYELSTFKGSDVVTNAVVIFSRPVLELDESGENGDEKYAVVYLTRGEVAQILATLEEDIAKMRLYCPDREFI